jgi:release factor glutamine methyltransferase
MKIKEMLNDGIYVLKERNIEDSSLKARILMSYLINKPKEYLITHDTEEISFEKQKEYYSYLDRLISGEPIQYITNCQEFMGLKFYVDKNVLIPQPDTEILAQVAIKYVKHIAQKENVKLFENLDKPKVSTPKILDLCTGSGAIAISLVKNLDFADVWASDISNDALTVAKKNAINNKAKLMLLESDLFENINEKFDVIVSNPPYIESNIIPTLDLEVQNEPHLALDGGVDGLDFYRKIAKDAKNNLTKNGMLFLEIGYNQKKSVENILKKEKYKDIKCLQDFSGLDRVIFASV